MKKLILITLLTISAFAQNLPINSVVKVFSSLSIPNYKQPWQTSQRVQITGSGVIIKDNYIITNAHVVSNGKYIQVSKNKESKKFVAKIKYISHQADLALLEVVDKEFYKDTQQLKINEDVQEGDGVTVLGYPLGGNSLSTTKGTVSRMEKHQYVWSYEYMFTIQIDAAINSGNSGGAAIDENNKLIGIVMQSYSKNVSDNIGYIIPSVILNTFLEDIKDKKIDGFDNSDTKIQVSKNKDLKKYYNLTSNEGALISSIEENEDVLKKDDILLEIEGNKVLDDGFVNTKYGLQSMSYFFHLKPVGQIVKVKVRRNNRIIDLDYRLKKKHEIIKYEYNKQPRYIIFGGFVFAPLTKNYLLKNNLNSTLFEVYYENRDQAKGIKEGVVIQYDKFSHEVNEGYNPSSTLIWKVNGVKVIDFNHFVELIDNSKDEYTIFEFLDVNNKYIINTKKAKESFEEIKNIYGLDKDRRVD